MSDRDFGVATGEAAQIIGQYSSLVKALARLTPGERKQVLDALDLPRSSMPDARVADGLRRWGYSVSTNSVRLWRFQYTPDQKAQLLADVEAGKVPE